MTDTVVSSANKEGINWIEILQPVIRVRLWECISGTLSEPIADGPINDVYRRHIGAGLDEPGLP